MGVADERHAMPRQAYPGQLKSLHTSTTDLPYAHLETTFACVSDCLG